MPHRQYRDSAGRFQAEGGKKIDRIVLTGIGLLHASAGGIFWEGGAEG